MPAMPLWLQGVFEFGQAALLSALAVVLPLAGVWFANGFTDRGFLSVARLAGQAWLLIHGVPLTLKFPEDVSSDGQSTGVLSLIPLGLSLIPFALAWRSGRRLARASYTDQLWQGLLGALGIYAALGLMTAYLCSTSEASASLLAGALIPLIPAGAGLVVGAYREAGSWPRLIGMDLTVWIAKTSQHSRWAGSYVWSAIRAGLLGITAATGLAAVLLATTIALHWADIVTLYERLEPGIVGGSVLTIAQLGFLPNLVGWSFAWSTGAGFALGTGSSITPLATSAGPLPAVPILGALPTGTLDYGFAVLILPVLAGVIAGWWFLREGENHFDEWLAIKIDVRWLTSTVSTLVLAVFIGVVSGLCGAVIAWLAQGSAGIGRFVDLGPAPLEVALWLAPEIAIGVVIGYALGPWLERERSA
ncbi:hypothetical protein GCM10009611_22870 [Arthrobacter roseus]